MLQKVVVVGVGALGSHFVLFGRSLPVQFAVIDFDRIEQKNVLAQFHTKMGVGRNKAQALQQTMQGMFGVRIDAVPHRLTLDNVEALLKDAAVIVDCLDNGASRKLVQDFARAKGTPCLHGALAADGQLGRVVWDEIFTIDSEDVTGQATCEGGEHLPFIGMVSTWMARILQMFLTDGKKVSLQVTPISTLRIG